MTVSASAETLDPIYLKRVDESYCERIARVFSRQYGIRVAFGQEAKTNATTQIVLPLAFCERWILDGVLDHEVAHVIRESKAAREVRDGWTASVKKAAALAAKDARYRALPMFLNAVEDVSIERESAETWAGVAVNLERSRRELIRRLDETTRDVSAMDAIGKAFIGEALGPSLQHSKNATFAGAAAFVAERLSDLLARARAARWTDESLAIALEICDRIASLRDEAEKAKEPEAGDEDGEPEAGDEDGEPEAGDVDSSDAGDGPESDEDASPSPGTEDGEDGSDPDDSRAEDGGETAPSPSSDPLPDVSPEEAERILKATDFEGETDSEAGTFDRDLRTLMEYENREVYAAHPEALARDREVRPRKERSAYAMRAALAKSATRALMTKLRLALLSSDDRTEVGLKKGRIYGPTLHRLARFNTRVFKREISKEIGIRDTAVEIFIDQSGSMLGIMDRVVSAVIAIGEALDTIGITFEVTGFSNRGGGIHRGSYHRSLPFEFQVYKTYDESWTREKERLGSCHAIAENADGEAVEWAAKRLLARPEKRKVLIVLSDGEPACGGDDNNAIASHLRRVLTWLEKKEGVEVVGIGLHSKCVKEFYRHHAVADSIDELPERLYKALRETMKK